MQPALELRGITKMFGTQRGVSDLNFTVEPGTVVGFLGPNGAGKSTTINLLLDYTRPTQGSASIFGEDVSRTNHRIRRDVGYLASDMALDGNLTGWQQIAYLGHLHGGYDRAYVEELAERLDCTLERKIKSLSRGNRQKVALIVALMAKPSLLLLDEPTSGLDPLMQAEFNKIILEHKAAGRTAFISSHVLSEVEELCDRLIFIRDGKIIADKSMQELTRLAPKHVRLQTGDKKLAGKARKLAGVSDLTATDTTITFAYAGETSALLQLLAAASIDDIVMEDVNLDEAFMQYYGADK